MLRKFLVFLFAFVSTCAQADYTQFQWGVDKTTTPYSLGAKVGTNWTNLGTISSAGVWLIPSSNISFTQTGTGAVATTLYSKLKETVSVTDFGADPTGVNDSAPAFTSAIASNRKIIVPPGTYTFRSKVSPPSCVSNYVCASDDAAVLIQDQSNFVISGYGATINVAPNIALTTAFLFFRNNNFIIEGLTVNGDRTGLTTGQENVAITLFSNKNFEIKENYFASGFGDNGAAFAADWLVNGKIHNNTMTNVGHCADFAFLKNVEIYSNYSTGYGTGGTAGVKCWSNIYDIPNVATNNTGETITQTDGLYIHDNYATNFIQAVLLTSGRNVIQSHNRWENNPGQSPSAGGYGTLIYYVPTGSFASVGFPPSDILIDGDIIQSNGGTIAGAGVKISCVGIANSDVVKNITIVNSQFQDNSSTGIWTDCTAASGKASNIVAYGNTFSGVNQTTAIDNNTYGLMTSIQQATSGSVSFTSNTATAMTSLTLPAGQWSVTAQLAFSGGVTTTVNYLQSGISTTSATIPSGIGSFASYAGNGATPFNYASVSQSVGPVVYQFTTPTTIYCNGKASFAVSTSTGYCNLVAERIM